MKNFFKKVAFVLALAMVLTNLAPAFTASAAAAPSLKYKSRVIYVGGSAFGDYTNSCWTPSQNTEGYKVAYKVKSGNLITVGDNGKITATGNGIGKAVVVVTYTKDGAPTVTEEFTVKVRRNSTDVRLVNAVIKQVAEPLSVGQEITLSSAKSFVGTSYKKGNYGLNNYMKAVSDQITYKVSDESIIKVEGNKLTAVGAGTATLTVVAYEYGDKTQTPVNTKDYTITVLGGLQTVKQVSTTELELTFAQAKEDLKISDFTITQVDSSIVYTIKELIMSSDKTVATIETYTEMTDGTDFILAYDGKDYPFTATDGKVAKIVNNRYEVPYAVGTVISVNLVDANGVVLDTIKNTTYRSDVDFEVEVTDGYMYDDKLYLYEKGKTAKLTITYRTGEIDSNGDEVGTIKETFVITATDMTTKTDVKATITDDLDCIDWDNLKENRNLYVADDNMYIHVLLTDEDGNDITQDYDYYLESSDENVFIVDSTNVHRHLTDFADDNGIYAAVHGVKVGTANVIVRNPDGKVVKTVPVTVKAERKYNNFTIDKATITLSNTLLENDTDTVELTFKDQYDEKFAVEEPLVELMSTPNNHNGSVPTWDINRKDTSVDYSTYAYTFSVQGVSVGTYRYKVTYKSTVKYFNVVVKAPSGSDSYKLVISDSTVDQIYKAGNGSKNVTIKVAQMKGGVLYQYLEYGMPSGNDSYVESLTIKKSSTDIYKLTADMAGTSSVTGAAIDDNAKGDHYKKADEKGIIYYTGDKDILNYSVRTVADSPITTRYGSISGAAVEKAGTGLRNVSAVVMTDTGKRITVSSSGFTVTDTQAAMNVTVNKTSLSEKELNEIGAATIDYMIRDAVTFKYNGRTINDNTEDARIEIVKIKSKGTTTNGATTYKGKDGVSAGDQIHVETVTVKYYVRDFNDNSDNAVGTDLTAGGPLDGAFVEFTVAVNRTFTIKQ